MRKLPRFFAGQILRSLSACSARYRSTLPRRRSAVGRRTLKFEPLEDRRLLAVDISDFPTLSPSATPNSIVSGPDGNLWFTESATNAIATMKLDGTALAEYPIPTSGSFPGGIAVGFDHNLWFTEGKGKIGRFDPTAAAGSQFTEYPLSPTIPGGGTPTAMAAGPDGNLWFVDQRNNAIGKITTSGAITEYTIPTGSSTPYSIAAGPDGNLWFTELFGNNIGRITPGGAITEFDLGGFVQPEGITAGPDGAVWFVEQNANAIARITPAGAISEYPLFTGIDQPTGITLGSDNKIYFTESGVNRIGQLDPVNPETAPVEFDVPTTASAPSAITAGSDFNIWFTEYSGSRIGRVKVPGSPNPPANIGVDVQANPAPVKVGNQITYTITVKNFSGQAAQNVVLYNPVPALANFSVDNGDSVSASQGTVSVSPGFVKGNAATAEMIAKLGTLNAGATATMTLKVHVTGDGDLAENAIVVSDSPDTFLDNNSVTLHTTAQPLNATLVLGGLLVGDATGNPMTYDTGTNTGSTGTFSWTVTHAGGDTATNLQATITLPPQLDASSVAPFCDQPGTFDYVDGQHITFHLPDVPGVNGDTERFGFTAKPTGLGDISVTASLTAREHINGTANPLTKTVTTTVGLPTTKFGLDGSVTNVDSPGQTLKLYEKAPATSNTANFSWTLQDNGGDNASNVAVSLTVPAGLDRNGVNAYPLNTFSYDKNTGVLTFAFGTMGNGDRRIFGFTTKPVAAGDIPVTATVATSGNVSGTISSTISAHVVPAVTKLALTGLMTGDSSGTPMLYDPTSGTGTFGSFSWDLSNYDGDTATNVMVHMTVPAALIGVTPFTSGSVTPLNNGDGTTTLTFTWPSIHHGEIKTFGFGAKSTRLGDIAVSATADASERVDGGLNNSTVHTLVETAATSLVLSGTYSGALMTISASQGTATPGTFSWTLTNTGGQDATDVQGYIPIPSYFAAPSDANLTIDSGASIHYNPDTSEVDFLDFNTVPVGHSVTFSITVTPQVIGAVSLIAFTRIAEPVVGGGYPSKSIDTVVLSSAHYHMYNPDPAHYSGEYYDTGLGKTGQDGPVIPNADLVPIFYGKQWKKPGPTDNWPDVSSYPQNLDAAMAYLVDSPYMDFLSYYGTRQSKIGRGQMENGVIVDASTNNGLAPALLDDGGLFPQIQGIVSDRVKAYQNAHNGVLPDPVNTLYVVYTPPGTVIKDGSGDDSTNKFLGYHSYVHYWAGGLTWYDYKYIAMPFQSGTNQTNAPLGTFDGMTATFSHELAEAVTDPDGETGWRAFKSDKALKGLTEIGDLARNLKNQTEDEGGMNDYGRLGNYAVQYEWANKYTYPGTDYTVLNQPVLPRDGNSKYLAVKKIVDPVTKTITAGGEAEPGYSYDGLIASFVDTSNPGTDPGVYTATIDWGDDTTSRGSVVYDPNLKQFLISGSHLFDAAAGSTATISVSLVDNANGDAARLTADVTLQETSAPAASLQFDQAAFDAYRNGSAAMITVDRVGDATLGASVDFHVSGGTAADGMDYQSESGTLEFAPGATTATIFLPVYSNPAAAGDLTVNLVLSTPTGNTVLGAQTTTTLTIHPSDQVFAPPPPTLDSDQGASVLDGITYTNGSAGAPLVFDITGAGVRDGYVQLVDVTDPNNPILLDDPVQAHNGAAKITLSGGALTDGTHQIVVINSVTAGAGARRASPEMQIVIDSQAPASNMAALPARTLVTNLPVSWAGNDNAGGTGVNTYDVTVSIDGSSPTPWLTDTALTSSIYAAATGHTYAFFAHAVDVAGNVEPVHAVADTGVDVTPTPWENERNPLDVSDDGFVAANDALIVINRINSAGSGLLPTSAAAGDFYLDVSGDGSVAPNDALMVINALNAGQGGAVQGEGEGVAADGLVDTLPLAARELATTASLPDEALSDLIAQLAQDSAQATDNQKRAAAAQALPTTG